MTTSIDPDKEWISYSCAKLDTRSCDPYRSGHRTPFLQRCAISENQVGISEALIMLTGDVVATHVQNDNVAVGNLPDLISKIHTAFSAISNLPGTEATLLAPVPAVTIRSAVKHNYVVCLEDGERFKMLKRYLAGQFGMTPDEYRPEWSLPAEYPMVAPGYAERRSELAKAIGLGKSPKDGRRRTAGRKRLMENA